MESDGSLEKFKKKDQATLRREMRKIRRNLEGVRELHGLPGAMVVVDPRREEICIREATRMNVPVVCILDTDCDPDPVDIVIPANDDAMSSVQLLLSRIADAVMEGRANVDEAQRIAAQKSMTDDVRARGATVRRSPAPGEGGGRGGPRRGGPRRGGPGGPGGGGGLRGRSTGRFADRMSGQADAISFGTEAREKEAAPETPAAPPPAAPPAAPAAEQGPAEGGAPAGETPKT